VIVSQKSLEAWVKKHSVETAVKQFNPPDGPPSDPIDISVQEVLCPHEELDHKKAAQMKCINQVWSHCYLKIPPLMPSVERHSSDKGRDKLYIQPSPQQAVHL
jgi:hypothetical protein